MKKPLFALCVLLFVASPLFAELVTRPHIKVELVSEYDSLSKQGKNWIGINFEIENGWHLYWKNPGDSGEPPKITWNLPQAISVGDIQWPTPLRIPVGPLMNFGYSDNLLLMIPIAVSSMPFDGNVVVGARVKWLVCKESCIPGEARLSLNLPVSEKPHLTHHAPLFQSTRLKLPRQLPEEWQTRIRSEGEHLIFSFAASPFPQSEQFLVFPTTPSQIENAAEQKVVRNKENVELRILLSEQLIKPLKQMIAVLVVENVGYDANLPVEAIPSGHPAKNNEDFDLAFLLKALLFAFIGGMILNLMPCVFPVLSIKALGIVKLVQTHNSKLVKLHALFYTLGILVSFWMLALVILLLRSGGEIIGWGFQLQSPWFVMGLSNVLFLMALNLFGVFEFGGTFLGIGSNLAAKEGYAGPFFTGVLATVVATPCTAPFMGTALAFALSQSAPNAFLIFTFLGAGLAAPYCAISFIPGVSKIIPKPGRWMVTFKELLAFPLLGTVIWLSWVFGAETDLDAVTKLISGFLFLGLAAFVYGRWKGVRPKLAALIIAVGAVSIQLPSQSIEASNPWQTFSSAKLLELTQKNTPVFIDFTAAWCVTCKVNEQLAFTQNVMKAMKDKGVVPMRADWTNDDPEITKALEKFGRNGVPLYILYTGTEGEAHHILPQILTPQIVLDELKNVR